MINVKAFGAKGDGVSDDAPAFAAAMATFGSGPPGYAAYVVGGTLTVPVGVYRIASPVRLTRSVRLLAEGSARGYPAVTLLADAGVDGLVVCGHSNDYENGAGSIVSGVAVKSAGGKNGPPARGIYALSRFVLDCVAVEGFSSHGIEAFGKVAAFCNVSASSARDTRIVGCGGHGWWIHGPDANCGSFHLDVSECAGDGIRDEDTLGNVYGACHTATNAGLPYNVIGGSARSIFLGCYSETDQQPSDVPSPSEVVGGLHGASFTARTCFQQHGRQSETVFPVHCANDGDGALYVGARDKPGRFFGFAPPGYEGEATTSLQRITASPVEALRGEWAGFVFKNLDGGTSLAIPVDPTASGFAHEGIVTRPGAVPYMPNGFAMGSQGDVFQRVRYGLPPWGTFERGHTIYFERPETQDDWMGAICVFAGTAGTYSEGLTCETDGSEVVALTAPSAVLRPADCLVLGVAGVTHLLERRIVSISGRYLTLNANCAHYPNTPFLPIAYRTPTWRRFGKLEAP